MDQATARAFDRDTHSQRVTKTARATSDKKDRRDNPIYASRELDEYGLTPNELRVYFRIARRAGEEGKCWESIPNMARAIGLGESTVRRCCQILALARLTSEHQIEGWTTERRINPISRWKNKAELAGIRNIVLRSEEKRTPLTRDRGIARATTVTTDGSPLSPETGAPLSPQQGLPLSPQTVEGIPSEGIPIEVNPKKEITHTLHEFATLGERRTAEEKNVCVPTLVDIKEIRKAFCDAHSFPNSKQIKNPGGWLYTSQDGRYDEVVLEWYREEERKAFERLTIRQKQEVAELEYQKELQERQCRRDADERIKAQEWERNAPQRERERLENEERDRLSAIEDCKRYWVQWANKPNLRDGFISATLPQDEKSKAEFQGWLAEREEPQGATEA